MPVRTQIPCRLCQAPVVIFLVERVLVARCSRCGDARPAREANQVSHPRLNCTAK